MFPSNVNNRFGTANNTANSTSDAPHNSPHASPTPTGFFQSPQTASSYQDSPLSPPPPPSYWTSNSTGLKLAGANDFLSIFKDCNNAPIPRPNLFGQPQPSTSRQFDTSMGFQQNTPPVPYVCTPGARPTFFVQQHVQQSTASPTFQSNPTTTFGSQQTQHPVGTLAFQPNSATLFGQSQQNAVSPNLQSNPTGVFGLPTQQPMGPLLFQPNPTNSFGQQQPQQLVGAANFKFVPTSLFGQQPAGSQVVQSNPQGMFGQQLTQQPPRPQFAANPTNAVGVFSGQGQLGTVIKFSPFRGVDVTHKYGMPQTFTTNHQCIICMAEYSNKSMEELRFEDYCMNRKGPGQQGSDLIQISRSPNLFWQTANTPVLGSTPSFGQTNITVGQTTQSFGLPNQSNNPIVFVKSTFGAPTATSTTVGSFSVQTTNAPLSAVQPQKPLFSLPYFSATTTQSQPSAQNSATNVFQNTPAPPAINFSSGLNQTAGPQASSAINFPGFTNSRATMLGQPTNLGSNFGRPPVTTFAQLAQPALGTNSGAFGQQQPLIPTAAPKPPGLFGSVYPSNVFQQQTQINFPLGAAQFSTENSNNTRDVSVLATDSFPDGPHLYGLKPVLKDDSLNATNPNSLKSLVNLAKKREELTGVRAKIEVHPPKARWHEINYKNHFFENHNVLRSSQKCLVIRKFNTNATTIYNKYGNDLIQEAEACLKSSSVSFSGSGAKDEASFKSSSVSSSGSGAKDEASFKSSSVSSSGSGAKDEAPFKSSSVSSSGSGAKDEASFKSSSVSPLHFDASSSTNQNSNSHLLQNLSDSVTKPKKIDLRLQFQDSTSKAPQPGTRVNKSVYTLNEFVTLPPLASSSPTAGFVEAPPLEGDLTSDRNLPEREDSENLAGVILSRPEYYMYPPVKDLRQYIDDNGRCIVDGLTIGRRGYGNVHFAEPVDITNMNLDEIVHFRHKEIVIYPDDSAKPPVGQGLNRRAQVTLDKIYPREKGSFTYITDVDSILQSDFVENLMIVTMKHACRFVDYRPQTGSWVFKVTHFSKYAFLVSDIEECEIVGEKITKSQLPAKKIGAIKEIGVVHISNLVKCSPFEGGEDTLIVQ